jgi:2,3-diaminopropionate biosynthesis protein SbnA
MNNLTKSIGFNGVSLGKLESLIGNTTLYKLEEPEANIYTKLEYENFFGSIKDRAAFFIMKNAILSGVIHSDTIIIESTSGNFGIALAGICKMLGLKFIPVIDPNICRQKEQVLGLLAYDVIKVTERDKTGGYLLNRLKAVNEFLATNPGSYNPNQYENPNNYLSYYYTLGEEICDSFDRLDFVFISVSSGGTVIGLSKRLKEKIPHVKVVAVDVEGSMIFAKEQKARKLPGIGASKRSPLIDKAYIDDIIILSEMQIVEGCLELVNRHNLLLGVSSGAAYYACRQVLQTAGGSDCNAVFISPDNGISYIDTVYSREWQIANLVSETTAPVSLPA